MDISDAADLIATARVTLMDELVAALPKEQRYTGLMIANAMAIAVREQRAGAAAEHDEATRLRTLLAATGGDVRATDHVEGDAELPVLRRAVRAAIRDGQFDAASRASLLMAHLARTAADWVAISNPKALRTGPEVK
jgi:hypothetical protein